MKKWILSTRNFNVFLFITRLVRSAILNVKLVVFSFAFILIACHQSIKPVTINPELIGLWSNSNCSLELSKLNQNLILNYFIVNNKQELKNIKLNLQKESILTVLKSNNGEFNASFNEGLILVDFNGCEGPLHKQN